MNAGAHGGETKDTLFRARGLDRSGSSREISNAEMGFSYRHSEAPEDVIFTSAVFRAARGKKRQYSPKWIALLSPAKILAAYSGKNRRLDLQEPAR